MDFCLDFLWSKNLFNHSLLVHQISSAQSANGAASACHLLPPAAQLLQQSGFCVGNEWECKPLCLCEFFLQRLFVFAHTDNFITGGSQFFLVGLQRASLGGATAGIGFGVTLQHYLASTVVAALDFVSILVNAKNFRYSVSYLHDDSMFMNE